VPLESVSACVHACDYVKIDRTEKFPDSERIRQEMETGLGVDSQAIFKASGLEACSLQQRSNSLLESDKREDSEKTCMSQLPISALVASSPTLGMIGTRSLASMKPLLALSHVLQGQGAHRIDSDVVCS
jgi:hypothetical protein